MHKLAKAIVFASVGAFALLSAGCGAAPEDWSEDATETEEESAEQTGTTAEALPYCAPPTVWRCVTTPGNCCPYFKPVTRCGCM